jgi:hypothetical protein
MKELGGYFELELSRGEHYHKDVLALNSARNCLKYILKVQQPTKVYLPAHCCDSLIEPLIAENVKYELYHIDVRFELIDLPELQANEKLLYINYFALKSDYVHQLHDQYGDALIVDNTQAFFERPIPSVDTFYSPRKFFGVADGGYLYTNCQLDEALEQDESLERMTQLLGRYEKSASEFYKDDQVSENSLINQPIKWMAKLTQRMLKSLDYENIALKRQRNFWALHSQLKSSNLFKQIEIKDFVPMVYPYWSKDEALRMRLIENKMYIAKYWQDAVERSNSVERNLIEEAVYLAVDQRIEVSDIQRIVECVHG